MGKLEDNERVWRERMELAEEVMLYALNQIPVITYPMVVEMVGWEPSTTILNHLKAMVRYGYPFKEVKVVAAHRSGRYWTQKMNTTKYFIRMSTEAREIHEKKDGESWPTMRERELLSKYLTLQRLNAVLAQHRLWEEGYQLLIPNEEERGEGTQAILTQGEWAVNVYVVPFRKHRNGELAGYLYRVSKLGLSKPILLLCEAQTYQKMFDDLYHYLSRKSGEIAKVPVYLIPWEGMMESPTFYLSVIEDASQQTAWWEQAVARTVPDAQWVEGRHVSPVERTMQQGQCIYSARLWTGDINQARAWMELIAVRVPMTNGVMTAGWVMTPHAKMTAALEKYRKDDGYVEQVSTLLRPMEIEEEDNVAW
jgi:hypothetical protein